LGNDGCCGQHLGGWRFLEQCLAIAVYDCVAVYDSLAVRVADTDIHRECQRVTEPERIRHQQRFRDFDCVAVSVPIRISERNQRT
jgi:hypothetical protein